jgi:hypothetical protein
MREFSTYWLALRAWRLLSAGRYGRFKPFTLALLSLCVPTCLATADSTGTHSLYTIYQDHEIMFHVSTMLPYTPNNQQQV